MNKKILSLAIISLVLITGCTAPSDSIVIEEPVESEKPIGGERDEHGCLGAAGYTWNKEVGACIREWELEDNQKQAAKIAVNHIGYTKGLTILKADAARCPGCFAVELKEGDNVININLKNWGVVDNPTAEPDQKTECVIDNDCKTGGCSGTICQSKDVEPIFTTCEWREEYACYRQIDCGCVNGKCQWKKTKEFEDCVGKVKSSSEVIV